MTPFDFPDAPTLDQEVTVDGSTFIWTPSPDRWRRAGVVVAPGTPILTALVPRVGLVNDAAIAVTLQGVGFTINSVVKFGATVVPSTFVAILRRRACHVFRPAISHRLSRRAEDPAA